ncbi:hypothetical protein [Burkholderia gladioli]
MNKRKSSLVRGLSDPFVQRIAQRYDAMEATRRWVRWEEYFTTVGGAGTRRADSAEAVRCSESTRARALHILDVILFEVRARGFEVAMGYACSHIDLRRDRASVQIRLVELGRRETSADTDSSKHLGHGITGAGVLVLLIDEYSNAVRRFKDEERHNIFDRLPQIVEAVEARHANALERLHLEQKRAAAVELARTEATAQEGARQAKIRRRDALLTEAKRWSDADLIRRYVASLDARIGVGESPVNDYQEWRALALEVADELDPSAAHLSPNI